MTKNQYHAWKHSTFKTADYIEDGSKLETYDAKLDNFIVKEKETHYVVIYNPNLLQPIDVDYDIDFSWNKTGIPTWGVVLIVVGKFSKISILRVCF